MRNTEEGKVGWVLLWVLGVPIPILVLLYLLRGCTWGGSVVKKHTLSCWSAIPSPSTTPV